MRIAAMVLGLLGGLISAGGVYWGWPAVGGGYLAWGIAFSLIGITGGLLALRKPKLSGILMLLGGIGGWSVLLAVLVFEGLYCRVYGPAGGLCDAHFAFYKAFSFACPPLFIGATLSLAASREYHRGSTVAMVLGLIGGFVSLLLVDVRTLYFADGMRAETIAIGLLLPAIGFAGGILALTKPASGGTLMLICGMGGILAAFLDWPHFAYAMGYTYASLPFFVGAAISFTAPGEYRLGRRPTLPLGIGRGVLGGFGAIPAFTRGSRLILALGVAGGVLGGFGSFPAFTYQCPVMIPWTSLVFLMAVGGAILALIKPKMGGRLMLLAAVAGWLAPVGMISFQWGIYLNLMGFYVAAFYFLAGLLLIAGGILALRSGKEQPAAISVAMILGISGGLFAGLCALATVLLMLGGAFALTSGKKQPKEGASL